MSVTNLRSDERETAVSSAHVESQVSAAGTDVLAPSPAALAPTVVSPSALQPTDARQLTAKELIAKRQERREAMRRESLSSRVARHQQSEFVCDPRVRHALDTRLVLAMDRTSTGLQVVGSTGSQDAGEDQVLALTPYGVFPDDARIVRENVLGEGASSKANRVHFERILDQLETGRFGIVMVMEIDRLARNHFDSGRFISAILQHSILVLSPDRMYDARNKQNLKELGTAFNDAVFDHSIRRGRSIRGRHADASVADVLIPTSTGLIVADPNDPVYRAAMGAAGLMHHLAPEMLAFHGECFSFDNRAHYILPFPDADVYACTAAMIRGITQYGSPRKLADAIITGIDGWPTSRRGRMPFCDDNIWDQHSKVRWAPVDPSRVRRFLQGGSLYGTYRHSAAGMRDLEDDFGPKSDDIVFHDLFPSFGTSSDEQEIVALLGRHRRARQYSIRGAEVHPLNSLRCSATVPAGVYNEHKIGSPCGLRLVVFYPVTYEVIPYHYANLGCGARSGHPWGVFPHIEDTIIDIVFACVSQEQMREAVNRIPMSVPAPRSPRQELRARIAELTQDVDGLDGLELRAHSEANAERSRGEHEQALLTSAEASRYRMNKRAKLSELREAENKLKTLKEDERDAASLTRAERDDLVALAADLPTLWERATRLDLAMDAKARIDERLVRELEATEAAGSSNLPSAAGTFTHAPRVPVPVEGFRRRLLNACIKDVHARPLGDSEVEVSVNFPSGKSVSRVVYAAHFSHAYAAHCYAWGQVMALGRSPEEVALEMNVGAQTTATRPLWTPNMVRTSVLLCEWRGTKVGAERLDAPSARTTLASIVEETGEPLELVRAAALRGYLGLATWHDGEYCVTASPAQIAAALPEFARREVATRMNWPLDDTCLLVKCFDHPIGGSRLENAATRAAGIAHDAAGARYTRKSMMYVDNDACLRMVLETAHQDMALLPREHWMIRKDARAMYGFTPAVLNTFLTIRLNSHLIKNRAVFHYMDPDKVAWAQSESKRRRAKYAAMSRPVTKRRLDLDERLRVHLENAFPELAALPSEHWMLKTPAKKFYDFTDAVMDTFISVKMNGRGKYGSFHYMDPSKLEWARTETDRTRSLYASGTRVREAKGPEATEARLKAS
jgi:hypothetical protein